MLATLPLAAVTPEASVAYAALSRRCSMNCRIAIPRLPPSWRSSVVTPVAPASSARGISPSVSVISGTNKKPIAKP